jgi:hypothetical protein
MSPKLNVGDMRSSSQPQQVAWSHLTASPFCVSVLTARSNAENILISVVNDEQTYDKVEGSMSDLEVVRFDDLAVRLGSKVTNDELQFLCASEKLF